MQADTAAVRQQLLEQGVCTRCRAAPAVDGAEYCDEHLADKRTRDARWRSEQREARRTAGLCLWCPSSGPPARVKPGETSCLACRVRRRRLPRTDEGVDNDVDKRRRIADRTMKHADGRVRYHGQPRRGQQPRAQLIAQDLRYAREGLDAAAAGYAMLDTDEVKQLPRIQRADIGHAADHQLLRVIGHCEDALERRGHFQQRHGRRDGE